MVRNQWYAVLTSNQLPKNKLVGVKRLNEKLLFWRLRDGTISCIFDRCCHRGASLKEGKLIDDKVQCPFHGFEYDKNGKVTCIPANGKASEVPFRYKVNSYVAIEKYDFIWIFWGNKKDKLPEIPFFEELKQGFYYSSLKDHWPMHYTRCIENQMDVVHIPFVHKTTIGKGNKTVVFGPKIKWENDKLTWYVKNVFDDGKIVAKSPKQMEEKEEDLYSLELIMPNLWQNKIADKYRIFASFTPVDDENTIIYLRFYQKFMTLIGLRNLIGFISKIYGNIILQQDKRVVVTQLPKESSLKSDEQLIMGDRPIIEFRKRLSEMSSEN